MFRRMILHALLMFVPSVQIRVPWRAPKMLIQAQCRALLSTMFRLVGITGRVQAVQLAVDSRTRRDVTRYVSSARQNQAISVVKSYPTSYQPKTWHWHTHVARITTAVTSCCGPETKAEGLHVRVTTEHGASAKCTLPSLDAGAPMANWGKCQFTRFWCCSRAPHKQDTPLHESLRTSVL